MSVHVISGECLDTVLTFHDSTWLLLGRVCHLFRDAVHKKHRADPCFIVHVYLKFDRLHRFRDCDVLEMLPRCPNIVCMDLRGCISITDATIEGVARACPQLEDIFLDDCARITVPALKSLVTRRAGLVSLGLGNCCVNDEAMHAFAEFCPHLQYLSISGCLDVTGPAIAAFARHAPHLVELNIEAEFGLFDPPSLEDSVTDSTVMAVAHHCPRLEVLHLQGRSWITAAAVEQILKRCLSLKFITIDTTDYDSEELLEQANFASADFWYNGVYVRQDLGVE